MIPRGGGYRRITAEDTGRDEVTNPMAAAEMTSVSSSSSGPKTLRVLYKEQAYEIADLSGDLTVSALKERIARLTEIPAERQRLIFSGKPLRPDETRLSQFKLEDGATVHLFPLPAAQPIPVATSLAQSSPSSNASLTVTNATALAANAQQLPQLRGQLMYEGVTLTPAHLDPYVMQTGREIKMWCTVLIFLSAISLFNNVSYFSATGNFGKGGLDSTVFILDTLCSAAGVAVGSMGLKSVRTLDIEDLRKYLRHLMMLAAACIVLRICWVFDVSEAVNQAYRKSKENQEESGEQADETQLDHNAVAAFTIEATLIALICIGAWLSCVSRAVRLHNAVLAYQQAPAASSQATGATATPTMV